MTKTMMIALVALTSASAFADQCAYISGTMAKRADLLLQNNAEVATLCEPCGETKDMAKVAVVRKANKASADYQKYQKVVVNGKEVDLAYTFLKVAPNKYVNVAKAIGCPAEGVSETLSK
jgi:hypothetical protein